MKNNRLERSLLRGFALLAACLILGLCTVVSIQQSRNKIKDVSETCFAYTKAAAEYIDGDRIAYYVETGEKDDYYHEIMFFLNSYLKNSNLQYYYVFVPYENDLVYIWDADAADTLEGPCELGYHEEYMENGKAEVEKIYRHDPPEEISFENDDTYGYIASAYSPIFNSQGQPVAVVGADVYVPNIEKEIIFSLTMVVVTIIAIIIMAVVLFFRFIHRHVVRPIHTLNDVSKSMVENLETENNLHIDIRTGNEIEELADSFEHMYAGIRDYIARLSEVTAEKERIGAELNVATKIQVSMLPCIFPAFPSRTEFDIYATMEPAKEVGGDFYDFFLVDDDHLALVMADVSGKGVPAALFMVIAKTLLKNCAQTGASPKDVLEKVNQQLCENNEAEMFVTVWLGILEISSGKLTCANAGHEYPALRRADGRFELFKDKHGFVLGGMEMLRFREYTLQLYPGDELYVYTDGVAEATDTHNALFGTDRMLAALNAKPGVPPNELLPLVKEHIDAFVGDAPQFDDITMLALRYIGPEPADGEAVLTIPAEPEGITRVQDFVGGILDKTECSMGARMKLEMAVEEIYVNIASYAYAPNQGDVTIRCRLQNDPSRITIRFEDSGIPFNPLAKPDTDITLSAEERGIGGLGILMVKKSMDDMTYAYENGKNILVITKTLG